MCQTKSVAFENAIQTYTHRDHPALLAIDGNRKTRQGTRGSLTLDLGVSTPVEALVLEWEACECSKPGDVTLETSVDNRYWTKVRNIGGFHIWGGRTTREIGTNGKRIRYVRITGKQSGGLESKWFSLWEVTAIAGCRDYYPYYGCYSGKESVAVQGTLTYEQCAAKATASGKNGRAPNLAFGLMCANPNSHGTCNKAECRLFDMGDVVKGRAKDQECSPGKDQAGRLMGGIVSKKKYVAVYTLSGLKASFYDFPQNAHLPPLKNHKPRFIRIEDTVDDVYDKGLWGKRMVKDPAMADHMAAQWTGRIGIPKDGNYKFWLNSDDGSKLWIDGQPVVDDDNLHSLRIRTGTVYLKKGAHAFKVEFFERDQGKGVEAEWQPPGGKRAIIPAGQFVPY